MTETAKRIDLRDVIDQCEKLDEQRFPLDGRAIVIRDYEDLPREIDDPRMMLGMTVVVDPSLQPGTFRIAA